MASVALLPISLPERAPECDWQTPFQPRAQATDDRNTGAGRDGGLPFI